MIVDVFVGALPSIVEMRADSGGDTVLGLDWAYWVILFWGLGVVGHAISVFFGTGELRNGQRSIGQRTSSVTDIRQSAHVGTYVGQTWVRLAT